MDTLAVQADKVAVKVQNLLSDETVKDLQGGAAGARQSLESLQAILKEQRGELKALSASLRRSAEGMEKVTTGPELEGTLKRVDKLVERLDGTVGTLDTSSKSLQSILGRMDRGEGTLGKLSTDETLYKNASEATANLNKATRRAQQAPRGLPGPSPQVHQPEGVLTSFLGPSFLGTQPGGPEESTDPARPPPRLAVCPRALAEPLGRQVRWPTSVARSAWRRPGRPRDAAVTKNPAPKRC